MKTLLTVFLMTGFVSLSVTSKEVANPSNQLLLKEDPDPYECYCFAENQEALAGGDNFAVFENAYNFCMSN